MTAITGQDLQDRGITDITSIVQSVPGVSMRTSGPGQTELEMRGMTSSGGNSSTVGFYLDDTPLTAPAAAQNGKVVIDPNLYDLNRVEVLRGPQGTLYGSGSMGGTIKLVPNAPDPSAFDASGEIILGHTDWRRLFESHRECNGQPSVRGHGGAAPGRFAGTLERLDRSHRDRATRLSRADQCHDSRQCRGGACRDMTSTMSTMRTSGACGPRCCGRRPTGLSIEPSFLYQEVTQGGLSLIDSQPGTYTNYQPYNVPEPFEDRIDIGSFNVRYHFDCADVSSTTSYWTRDEPLREDGTEELADGDLGAPIYPSQGGAGPNSPPTL